MDQGGLDPNDEIVYEAIGEKKIAYGEYKKESKSGT